MRKTLLLLLLAAAPAPAFAGPFDATVSTSASAGRYGGAETSGALAFAWDLRAAERGWELGFSLPYYQVDSAGPGVLPNGVALPETDSRERRQGYGDLTVTVGRPVRLDYDLPFDMRVEASFKIPTGASGLSTGRADAEIGVDLSRNLGRVIPSLSIGYRVTGDRADLELPDGMTVTAGAAVPVGRTWVQAYYQRWPGPDRSLPAAEQVLAMISGPFNADLSWGVYAGAGLSAGAPDLMIGTGLTARFGPR